MVGKWGVAGWVVGSFFIFEAHTSVACFPFFASLSLLPPSPLSFSVYFLLLHSLSLSLSLPPSLPPSPPSLSLSRSSQSTFLLFPSLSLSPSLPPAPPLSLSLFSVYFHLSLSLSLSPSLSLSRFSQSTFLLLPPPPSLSSPPPPPSLSLSVAGFLLSRLLSLFLFVCVFLM